MLTFKNVDFLGFKCLAYVSVKQRRNPCVYSTVIALAKVF